MFGKLSVWLFILASVPVACGRQEEPTPAPSLQPGQGPSVKDKTMQHPPIPINPEVLKNIAPLAMPSGSASASASSSTSASASASGSASGSASASASASGSAVPVSPFMGKLLGYWKFARFDLTDKATAERWAKVPGPTQIQILSEAPQATMEIAPTKLISRLPGVADKNLDYTVMTEADPEVTLKTTDGRKKLKMLDGDTVRVEDLDKKDGLVAIFTRKKLVLTPPSPVTSAPPPPKLK